MAFLLLMITRARLLACPRTPARAMRRVQLRGGARRLHARRSRVGGVRGHVWAPQTKVRQPDRLARYVARQPRAPTKQMGPYHRSRDVARRWRRRARCLLAAANPRS